MASNQYNPRRQQQPAAKKKKRSGASASTRPQVPGWAWLVAGVVVGVFVSFLVKLAGMPATGTLKDSDKAVKSAQLETAKDTTIGTKDTLATKSALSKGAEKSAEKSADKDAEKAAGKTSSEPAKPATRFDFYTLLPEREVIVPNEREAIKSNDKQKANASQTPTTETDESFFMQVGSFRSAQEADRRRAQIILLGLDAKVESVQANGDTWYRVQSGPFASRDKLSKARTQLSGAGIESLLLKQKPQG
ncbi:MAG TPA: SPOR domain-containing protein [Spongiibacteraceae bacterium]|nr:SPOR domain-containing protein [Spongiibacteraceae bacterium]